ncbi:putative polysaccharide deacetylase family protein [Neofusicoccum parvum UCRNP2]|uniref:Putative polysaccharide deacetylase family protein n=1 Tax=Botryosphaeria parva (strain UCR-NP2) TaxID=1287680 RepID=R1G4G2_BOTPV|nr:putative polysaccharide deacetylase family protein [Neofusicoccum parvum UCRNP2]
MADFFVSVQQIALSHNMPRKRVLVGYGIDVDAVANWINTGDGTPQNPTNVSRGIYGATVGVDRLLKLWDKYSIKTTWFSPAHTVESFPKQMARIRDAGHEIGLHGYTHEFPGSMSAQQQHDVLAKSIDVLTKFTGTKPLGYTAPAWSTSKELIPQLEAFGILYDHSFMHHDVQPYYAPDSSHQWVETNHAKDANHWMRPMTRIRPSKIVEIPANWHLGHVDTAVVEKLWREQFDFAYREYDSFIFPISIHPQVSGKPQVILMHERVIEYINKHEGVEWMTFGQMAREFKEGRIAGVEIEGGVDP